MKKFLAFALALCLALTLAACVVAEAPAVMSHEEYIAAELDTEVTIETYVQAKQSWWNDQAIFYGHYAPFEEFCGFALFPSQ